MSRQCSICSHIEALTINQELVRGKTLTSLSRRYGVSIDALSNHKNKHLSRQLTTAWSYKVEAENKSIVDEIYFLIDKSKEILAKAEEKKSLRTSLKALREIRESLKLYAAIAFNVEQAKAHELEMSLSSYEADEKEREESRTKLIFKRLSSTEVHLLSMLLGKIDSDKKEDLIINEDLELSENVLNLLYIHQIEENGVVAEDVPTIPDITAPEIDLDDSQADTDQDKFKMQRGKKEPVSYI